MKKKTWFAALLLVPLGVSFAFAQEKPAQEKPQDKKATPAAAPSDDPMMQKWIEYGTPGAAHKALDPRVGKFTYEMKCWDSPGASPMTSKGTSEAKWIMNGRFIEEKVSGDWMGKPFNGTALVGYDNLKKLKKNEKGEWVKSHTEYRINEAQAETVRAIFRAYADGHGHTTIAKALNGNGEERGPKGQRRRVLRRSKVR